MNFPRIQVTIEHMRAQVLHAFSEYETEWTEMMRAAVKAELTPEKIAALVHKEVTEQFEKATSDYVGAAIREAIRPVIEERVLALARAEAKALVDRLYEKDKR